MRAFSRRFWALASIGPIAVVVLLLAAACSGSSEVQSASQLSLASARAEEQDQTVEQQALPLVSGADAEVAAQGEQGQTVERQALSLVSDADAIVAAQEQVLNRIYETALPTVVHIRVTQTLDRALREPRFDFDSPFRFGDGPRSPQLPEDFFQRGEGSGFVWDDQGHVVTNHHVIENASKVIVILADSTELEAEVVGSDPDSDLAVLKVDFPQGSVLPVTLGDSAALKVGQLATAIGNPFGQEFTMTSGIISALGRTIRGGASPFSIPEVIQTDAPINPGNSGGPLLDRQGRVIGINTQILSRSGSSSGIGFAVPINTAKQVVPTLITDGSFEYAWLGISGTTLNRDVVRLMDLGDGTRGSLVASVAKDSPADDAGLRGSDRTKELEGVRHQLGGDVIVDVDGTAIDGTDDLISYLNGNTRPADRVTLAILRDGERIDVEVTLGKRPPR